MTVFRDVDVYHQLQRMLYELRDDGVTRATLREASELLLGVVEPPTPALAVLEAFVATARSDQPGGVASEPALRAAEMVAAWGKALEDEAVAEIAERKKTSPEWSGTRATTGPAWYATWSRDIEGQRIRIDHVRPGHALRDRFERWGAPDGYVAWAGPVDAGQRRLGTFLTFEKAETACAVAIAITPEYRDGAAS